MSQQDVVDLQMTPSEYVDAVETGLAAKAEGRVDMPPKLEILPQGSDFIHAMPCAVHQEKYCGIKWISGYFDNPGKTQLPALMGLIILNDARTGMPLAVMDCMEITKMRTAAVSGVAMRHLANKDSKKACILGCGNQGQAHLEFLISELPSVNQINLWNPTAQKAHKIRENASMCAGRDVAVCDSIRQAMQDCDVVLVTGPGKRDDSLRAIEADWIKPGATVITVNHDAEFKRGAISQCADKVYIDDVAMYHWSRKDNLFDGIEEEPLELGRMLIGQCPARESREEIIFSMPIGIAIDDLVCAAKIYDKAIEQGRGVRLPM